MTRKYAPTALVAMYTFFVFTFSKGIEGDIWLYGEVKVMLNI
jgi:hypothetical protein